MLEIIWLSSTWLAAVGGETSTRWLLTYTPSASPMATNAADSSNRIGVKTTENVGMRHQDRFVSTRSNSSERARRDSTKRSEGKSQPEESSESTLCMLFSDSKTP